MEGNGIVRVEEKARAVTISVPHGKPYAGKLHVRFDEGAGVPDEGRPALLYARMTGFEWYDWRRWTLREVAIDGAGN